MEPLFLNYRYTIEIEGIVSMAFKEMTEISNETTVHTYKEGGLNEYVHKFPEHTEYTNIELKHGLSTDNTLHNWREDVINGKMSAAKKDGTIKFYGYKNGEQITKVWGFYDAWPSKIEVSGVDASSNADVIIESVELVMTRLERK